MTTINGSFTSCGAGKWFALNFACSGHFCPGYADIPNTTCITKEAVWSCSNGVQCRGHTNWTSYFSYSQPSFKIDSIQEVIFKDRHERFVLTSDGTANATVVTQKDFEDVPPTGKCFEDEFPHGFPFHAGHEHKGRKDQADHDEYDHNRVKRSSAAPSVSLPRIIYVVFILAGFLLSGCLAATPSEEFEFETMSLIPQARREMTEHEISESWKAVIGIYSEVTAKKIDKAKHKEPLFAETLTAEFEELVCDKLWVMLAQYATEILELPIHWVEHCSTIAQQVVFTDPESMLMNKFVSDLLCGILFNYMGSPVIEAIDETCQLIHDELAELHVPGFVKGSKDREPDQFLQFINKAEDPENCGTLDNKCESGFCINGACASLTCEGLNKAPGAVACGPGNGCFCAEDENHRGFCVLDTSTSCSGIGLTADQCSETEHKCALGHICTASPRCGVKMCLDARSCDAGAALPPTPPPLPPDKYPSPGDPITVSPYPLSGWMLSIDNLDGNYISNDISLPENMYLSINGKLTVNTRCLLVHEANPISALPGDGTIIPKNSVFEFATHIVPNPDTCCLWLFENDHCDTKGGPGQRTCDSVYSGLTLFDTRSWVVYNCQGPWTGQPQ